MITSDTITQLEKANQSFIFWRKQSLSYKINIINNVKKLLLKNTEHYAKAITFDMHKPISQAIAEVKKCAYLCDYYIENIDKQLQPKTVSSPFKESIIKLEPLGVLLGVMPWNYPFWQVMRFAIPNLLLGNTIVIKHASNVPKSAELLENLFKEASSNKNIYQNLPIKSSDVASVIAHPIIKAISLTGSEKAGKSVAENAGKYLKKCVLELGGSNAFIICEDVSIHKIIKKAVLARMQNAGQSCIAAKRFLVHESKISDFITQYKEELKTLKTGDKFNKNTTFGAMAREDLALELEIQLNQSIAMGAIVICGGKRVNNFFEPTLITNVTLDMPVVKDETFGPLAVVIPFKTIDQAIEISNSSEYGLGVSIFSENTEKIKSYINEFNEGAVFINEMVMSDPSLPFGGINKSGYGRELSELALYEFANIKTVAINYI